MTRNEQAGLNFYDDRFMNSQDIENQIEGFQRGYLKGQADLLMPYDVESIDELIANVKAKVLDDLLNDDEILALYNTPSSNEYDNGFDDCYEIFKQVANAMKNDKKGEENGY